MQQNSTVNLTKINQTIQTASPVIRAVYKVFLALTPLRLYANSIREQTYIIPEITDLGEDVSPESLKLEVVYRTAKKFTKLNNAVMPWVFRFKPTEFDVGTHIIGLAVRDPKINK
jgi:hypothetical protein